MWPQRNTRVSVNISMQIVHWISSLMSSSKVIDDITRVRVNINQTLGILSVVLLFWYQKTRYFYYFHYYSIAIIIYFSINILVTAIYCFINFITICYYCQLYKRPTVVVTVTYYFLFIFKLVFTFYHRRYCDY